MTSPDLGFTPEGIISLLDTDLYKLTMQCAVLRHYPDADCTYSFINRTPDLKLTRRGFNWLQTQISNLSTLSTTQEELDFLKTKCPFLADTYIAYLSEFRFQPDKHLLLTFAPVSQLSTRAQTEEDSQDLDVFGDLRIDIQGKWVETILYEIPLLVLVSETYFRFSNTDWDYEGQENNAYTKGFRLLENGCLVSEFGTRRRRSYHTQDLVLKGLLRARDTYSSKFPDGPGRLLGTSNVHFAHRFDLNPIGTVGHEWMMGIAALTSSYKTANEIALREWVACFGGDNLSIALTDTFGTPQFLNCFKRECNLYNPPRKYAEIFKGVRQDSGDPTDFVRLMRRFYNSLGIQEKKTIVFSDALDIDKCLKYKKAAEEHGFATSFGVGTYLTNDFVHRNEEMHGKKSIPLNIVIKISSANGRPAIKISDNIGKNTGDKAEVLRVKQELGYEEKLWDEGDEMWRWGGKVEDELEM